MLMRINSDETNQIVKTMHIEHLKLDTSQRNNRLKWVVYNYEVRKSNRRVDRFMKRSVISVIKSFFYRKANKISTTEIYSYSGDIEAQRLLNRGMLETLKECLHYKSA